MAYMLTSLIKPESSVGHTASIMSLIHPAVYFFYPGPGAPLPCMV